MKKNKVDLVKNWLEKARRDLITAKIGLEYSEHFADIICFHAQQAGEKYIKAFLIFHEMAFPKTHSIEDLLLLAAQKDQAFLSFIDRENILTPYAVEIRYGESEPPSLEDEKSAIKISEELMNLVFEKLPAEIVSSDHKGRN
jgi:HEPN domain-containing protein